MLPNASIQKISGGSAGAVPPTAIGINAIIAAAAAGTKLLAGSYATQATMLSTFGAGPLAEYGSYNLNAAQKPAVMISPNTTTVGTYASFSAAGVTGSSAVTTSAGTSTPLDEYAFVRVNVVNGGTIGVAGITYTYTLDGGTNTSGNQNLGTANTITLNSLVSGLSTGVSFALGAGTLNPGDAWTCYTTRPQMNNADLVGALEALRISQQPWENVLIDQDATSTTVNTVDTWLAGLETAGRVSRRLPERGAQDAAGPDGAVRGGVCSGAGDPVQ